MARRRRRKTDENLESVDVLETPKKEEVEEEQIVESVVVGDLEPFDDYTSDYDQEDDEISELIEEPFVEIEEEPILEEVDPEEPEEQEEAEKEETKPKKDLNKFFEEDKKKVEKLKKKKEKVSKPKKKSKRQLQKEKDYEAIKDKRIYKYRGKKYTKVEDFIKYLNDHYLDIEQIASEVLEDENFLGWISKKSGTFKKSIEKFKEIKQEIENN